MYAEVIWHLILSNIEFLNMHTYRSLEYVCANTTALCLFQTDIHSVTDTADASQTMDISARAEVLLPVLDMIGPLKLCSAPSYFFKRQPLVSPSEVHCQPWFISFRPHEREGYVLYPNSEGEQVQNFQCINKIELFGVCCLVAS